MQAPVTASVKPNVTEALGQNVVESTGKAVEIVKGDTLWGLSRKYGVYLSIDLLALFWLGFYSFVGGEVMFFLEVDVGYG